jgi:hypothetical protein
VWGDRAVRDSSNLDADRSRTSAETAKAPMAVSAIFQARPAADGPRRRRPIVLGCLFPHLASFFAAPAADCEIAHHLGDPGPKGASAAKVGAASPQSMSLARRRRLDPGPREAAPGQGAGSRPHGPSGRRNLGVVPGSCPIHVARPKNVVRAQLAGLLEGKPPAVVARRLFGPPVHQPGAGQQPVYRRRRQV